MFYREREKKYFFWPEEGLVPKRFKLGSLKEFACNYYFFFYNLQTNRLIVKNKQINRQQK